MEIGLFNETWNIEIRVYLHLLVFSVYLIVSVFYDQLTRSVGSFILNFGLLDCFGTSLSEPTLW